MVQNALASMQSTRALEELLKVLASLKRTLPLTLSTIPVQVLSPQISSPTESYSPPAGGKPGISAATNTAKQLLRVLDSSRHSDHGGSRNRAGHGWGCVGGLIAVAGSLLVPASADSDPEKVGDQQLVEYLSQVWHEALTDLQRLQAQGQHAGWKGPPEGPFLQEGVGHTMVSIPLAPDLDLYNMKGYIRLLISRTSPSSVRMYDMPTRTEWQVTSHFGSPCLHIQLVKPADGSLLGGELKVWSSGGWFKKEDLPVLGELVRTASLPPALTQPPTYLPGKDHWGHPGGLSDHLGNARPDGLRGFAQELEEGLRLGREMWDIFRLFDERMKSGDWSAPLGLPDEQQPNSIRRPSFGGPRQLGGPQVDPMERDQGPSTGEEAPSSSGAPWTTSKAAQAIKQLESLGARVYIPEKKEAMDWGILAGYEEQKRVLEDCLLLPLQHPEVYAKVAQQTRQTYSSIRPRAVLFEGPPGTGKTTSARVLSTQASIPLVYVPLEVLMSKWFGESEKLLGSIFQQAEVLGGSIIFLDELDSLATSRDREIHEVSRRLLSILLREIDGFCTSGKTVVIGATNRKQDLDAALLSRFDIILTFGLPDAHCRALILGKYAKQLNEKSLTFLADMCEGMSGRDLRDICEQTERRWAAKIIRKEVNEDQVPPVEEYLLSVKERRAVQSPLQNGEFKEA